MKKLATEKSRVRALQDQEIALRLLSRVTGTMTLVCVKELSSFQMQGENEGLWSHCIASFRFLEDLKSER